MAEAFREAADLGIGEAGRNLRLYLERNGFSNAEVIAAYESGTTLGNDRAAIDLDRFLEGIGTSFDDRLAALRRAADAGTAAAFFCMAHLLDDAGAPMPEVVQAYEAAIGLGLSEAAQNLALYLEAQQSDPAAVVAPFESAIDLALTLANNLSSYLATVDPTGRHRTGLIVKYARDANDHLCREERQEAMLCFQAAASLGDADAAFRGGRTVLERRVAEGRTAERLTEASRAGRRARGPAQRVLDLETSFRRRGLWISRPRSGPNPRISGRIHG